MRAVLYRCQSLHFRYSVRLFSSQLGDPESRIWTIPNAMTMLRLGLSPVVGAEILSENYVEASAIFLVACFLDVADGWVARRFRQTSKLGSYLDPLADKVLIACTAVPLGILGVLPPHLVALWAARDTALVAGGLYLRSLTRPKGVPFFQMTHTSVPTVEPTRVSKLNTGLQGGLAVVALLGLGLKGVAAGEHAFAPDLLQLALSVNSEPFLNCLYAVSAALNLWSWGDYTYKQRQGYLKYLTEVQKAPGGKTQKDALS